MAIVTATVRISGTPLRRAFVEHTGPFGIGSLGFTLTDDNGSFTLDAGLLANQIDVKIHCRNSVVRVVNGGLFNTGISFNAVAASGTIINITSQPDHYRILNKCLEIYDTVWRQFRPYSAPTRRDFPLGKQNTVRQTFQSNSRIELSYPDNFPSVLAFVEPAGLNNNGFPLAHIKHRTIDGRLFGEGDAAAPQHDASLLPHELGHVFHFSAMSGNQRVAIEAGYVAFLMGQAITGDSMFHNLTTPSAPLVAYLEAIGAFSERFFQFKKLVQPNLNGLALRNAFVRDELLLTGSSLSRQNGPLREPQVQVARRNANGSITPLVPTGDNVEGAVYGAIFLDFGNRIGLLDAVELVLASGATNFDEFRLHVLGRNNNQWTTAINAVKQTWNL